MGSDAASLAVAQRVLGHALAATLEHIPESDRPEADLRSTDGAHVAEVKRITSGSLRKLGADMDRYETNREIPELTRHWMVALEAKTNSDSLPPMPKFAEPSTQARADYEAAGLIVQSTADREAEFRAKHPGQWESPPKVKGLIDRLVPHFKVLEAHGVAEDSRRWAPWFKSDPVSTAQVEILRAIRGGTVSSSLPENYPTGITLMLGWGYTRTERADTIAGRVQTWLDGSPQVRNLRASLQPVSPKSHRHGVLVFDPLSEPEFEAIVQSAGDLPTTKLHLPPEVDTLWAVFGDRGLSYSEDRGWRSHTIESRTE